MRKFNCTVFLTALTLALPVCAAPEAVIDLSDGRVGAVAFKSFDKGAPLVYGRLRIPDNAKRLVPAVLIVHGSAGVRESREGRYAAELNRAGFATFVTDHFTPRGVRGTTRDQSRVRTSQMIADAFAALFLLAGHPAIDAERIAITGFSKGGTVALNTAFEPFRRRFRVPKLLAFAAHIPIYPYCNLQFREIQVNRAPMLLLLGGADNYTPAKFCLDYAGRLQAAGGRVATKVYAGAHHGFDGPDGAGPIQLSQAQNLADCRAWYDLDTWLIDPESGKRMASRQATMAHFRRCIRRGATVGGDASARRLSMQDLKAFLSRHLKQR